MKQPVKYNGRIYEFTSEDARVLIRRHMDTNKVSDRVFAAWQHSVVYTDIMRTTYGECARDLINDGVILSVREYELMVVHQGSTGLF